MRKLVAVLGLTLVASTVTPAVGAPSARYEEVAFASWTVPAHAQGHFHWFGALVWRARRVPNDDWPSFAGVFKGECVRTTMHHVRVTECHTKIGVDVDPYRDVQMSVIADQATLHARWRGHNQVVRWTAAHDPSVGAAKWRCGPGASGRAGFETTTRATAHLFGHRFGRRAPRSWSFLSSGAIAKGCGTRRSIDFDPGTGRLAVSRRVPLKQGRARR